MVGGKRTCQICRSKFYKAELINQNMTYWCQPCWQIRQKKIANGNKTLKVYKPTMTTFTRIPGIEDYCGVPNTLKNRKA